MIDSVFFQLFPIFFIFGAVMLIFELGIYSIIVEKLNGLKSKKSTKMLDFMYENLSPKVLFLFFVITVINAVLIYVFGGYVFPAICGTSDTFSTEYKTCVNGLSASMYFFR